MLYRQIYTIQIDIHYTDRYNTDRYNTDIQIDLCFTDRYTDIQIDRQLGVVGLEVFLQVDFGGKFFFLKIFFFYHPYESINCQQAEFLAFKEKSGSMLQP